MQNNYKSESPNQIHQLLVTVSKHFHIGAKNQLRYQWKAMDVTLKNFHKSERNHLVHYLLRDHFSGIFYVEMHPGNSMIPIDDFLLRAWLTKEDSAFCGLSKTLMIPKSVEDYYPSIDDLLNTFNIEKINPPSGFASGIREIPIWEERVRVTIAIEERMSPIWVWNPQITARLSANINADRLELWRSLCKEVLVPSDNYALSLGSSNFKFSREYPKWEEVKKKL